jgi:tetratricopeptide (TPR) repeat protein
MMGLEESAVPFRTFIALFMLVVGLGARPVAADDMDAQLRALADAWAKVYYQTPDDRQEPLYPPLVAEAERIAAAHPDRAEPLIWETIVISSYANAKGGLGALELVEKARDLAMRASRLDPKALDAGGLTAVGVLYYKVPGWPVGFGNDAKARQYLEQALALAPDAMGSNFFYADFLIDQGDTKKARLFLERALKGPSHPGYEAADAGRLGEIERALKRTENRSASNARD